MLSVSVSVFPFSSFFFFVLVKWLVSESFYIHISFLIKYFSPCFGNVAVLRFVSKWGKIEILQRTDKLKYDFERTVREG